MKKLVNFSFLFILILLNQISSETLCQSINSNKDSQSNITVIKNVRVFDGVSVLENSSVVIKNTKIFSVGKIEKISDEFTEIDGSGCTLIPGLIDSHCHIFSEDNLRQYLAFGVTTVIDMFTFPQTLNKIKKMQSENPNSNTAYMISAGLLATVPGGHGTEYGQPIPTITKPEDAEKFVQKRIEEGSDFIKIIYDDGSCYNFPWPTLDIKTITALIKAAREKGKLSVVHAATLKNCTDVIEAGADGLAHMYFDSSKDYSKLVNLMKEKKAFIIPTLSVVRSMSGLPFKNEKMFDPLMIYLKPSDKKIFNSISPWTIIKSAYEKSIPFINGLKKAGVPILAGTDSPNPGTIYGYSLLLELLLLNDAGLSNIEVLRSATSVPADIFKMTGRGFIRPGMQADLVLINGNPIKDLRELGKINSIWKNGRKINRDEYLKEVKLEEKKIEDLKNAPPPINSESGLISDFEDEKITSKFGSGWMVSTDVYAGGKSKAEMKLINDGAENSKKSLLITGKILNVSTSRWAGVFFSPGKTFMAPANLSSKKSITFLAKGDSGKYAVMIFSQSSGFTPSEQTFTVGKEWKIFEFSISDFKIEGYDIMGIFIGAVDNVGDFSLQIDNVILNKKE